VAKCAAWREAPPAARAVDEILPHARRAGEQVLRCVTELLTQLANHGYDGKMPGVLPATGFSLEVDPRSHDPDACALAAFACAATVYALLSLRRTFVTYCDCAVALTYTADGGASAARARAVKRDICLLAGTYTNLINGVFRQLAAVLSVAAVSR
jgi:hypothetical protein